MDQDWESERRRALYERALESAGADFRDGSKLSPRAARSRPPGTPWTATPARRWRVACAISSDASSRSRTRASRRPRGRRSAGRRRRTKGEARRIGNESAGESLRAGAATPAARAACAVAVAVTERRRWRRLSPPRRGAPVWRRPAAGTPSAEASAGETDEKRAKKPPPPRRRSSGRRQRLAATARRASVAAASTRSRRTAEAPEAQEVHLCRTRGETRDALKRVRSARSPLRPRTAAVAAFTARLEAVAAKAIRRAASGALRPRAPSDRCPGSGETFACALRWRCARGDDPARAPRARASARVSATRRATARRPTPRSPAPARGSV